MQTPNTPPRRRNAAWPLRLGAVAFALLIALAWFAPRHINWAPLKPELSNLLSRQLGTEVEIAGGLGLEILPRPRLTAANVRLNGEEATGQIRWLRGSLDPVALITGALVPRDLEVVEADLTLPFDLGGVESLASTSTIRIENGTLRLTGTPDWFPDELARINGSLMLGGGPGRSFAFDGDARIFDEPVGLSVEGRSGGRLVLGLAHGPSATDLALQGQPDEFGSWRGQATLVLEEAAFLSTLRMEEMARFLGDGPAVLDLRIQALPGGTLVSVVDSIDASRMSGSGVVTVTTGARPMVDVELNLGRLVFDRDGTGTPERLISDAVRALEDLSEVDVTLYLRTQRIEFGDTMLRGGDISLAAGGGTAVIDRVQFVLPHQTDVQFNGELSVDPDTGWRLSGPAEIRTANARALLEWAGLSIADQLVDVPAGRLGESRFHADLTLEPSRIMLEDMGVAVDDSTWAGTFVRHAGGNGAGDLDSGSISLVLQGDRLNLDRYLPDGWSWSRDWLISPLDRDILIYLDRATLYGVPTDGLIIGLNAQANTLPSLNVAILNLAGADGSIDMHLDGPPGASTTASATAMLNVPAPDVFLGALGMPARQAARFASFGETELRLDLSYAPDQGIGYAFRATGTNSLAAFNGTAKFGAQTQVSISDGLAETPDWSVERISGACVRTAGENGWSCPNLSGRFGIFALNGAADLFVDQAGERSVRLQAIGTEVDFGAAIADTGLPILPEGTVRVDGELTGSGPSWETAVAALSGTLDLTGNAQLSIQRTNSGVSNVRRLRRRLNEAFGESGTLSGQITVSPRDMRATVTLTGNGSRAQADGTLNRTTDNLRATVRVLEGDGDAPALQLEADGPSGDPDIRLSGRWVTGG